MPSAAAASSRVNATRGIGARSGIDLPRALTIGAHEPVTDTHEHVTARAALPRHDRPGHPRCAFLERSGEVDHRLPESELLVGMLGRFEHPAHPCTDQIVSGPALRRPVEDSLNVDILDGRLE